MKLVVRGRLDRRIAGLHVVGAVAASTLGIATSATAFASTSSQEDQAISFLEENMTRFEVPIELRADLLAKALSGAILDADVPGAVPTATDTVTNELGTFPVNRFADGSFDSLGVSEEVAALDGGDSLRAIKNCTTSGGGSGTSYTGCQVYHWTLWHNMYFNAHYARASNAGSISYMGDRGFDSGNSCVTETFQITKPTGNNAAPERADWVMSCTEITGVSSSKSLGLRVSGTSAYSVQNY